MPPYGLYSLANTPEELLSRGYDQDVLYDYDPAFGQLRTVQRYLDVVGQKLHGVRARAPASAWARLPRQLHQHLGYACRLGAEARTPIFVFDGGKKFLRQ